MDIIIIFKTELSKTGQRRVIQLIIKLKYFKIQFIYKFKKIKNSNFQFFNALYITK